MVWQYLKDSQYRRNKRNIQIYFFLKKAEIAVYFEIDDGFHLASIL